MKRAIVGLAALFMMSMLAQPAAAASGDLEDFTGWAPGPPLVVQDDWKFEGAGKYDVGMFSDINGNAVRISNGMMSGSFSDWLFSPALDTPATESVNREFVAEFDLKSMLPNQLQPGLQISVAPQSADGARMSFLKFADTADGIVVSFSDVQNPDGVFEGGTFRQVELATLDRSVQHHVKIVMDLYEGPHNDVVQVFIDDMSAGLVSGVTGEAEFDGFFAPVDNQPTINKAKAGQTIPMKWKLSAPSFATSWEDYYRYDSESNAGVEQYDWTTRQVDSLVFQARCAQPSLCANNAETANGTPVNGNGFLIDNVSYSSAAMPTLPIATVSVTDPDVYGTPVFTTALSAASECSPQAGTLDPLEVYAPGASGLTYNQATGVWHYNVQTPKSYAGKCVEMTLNGFDESAQFKFVK